MFSYDRNFQDQVFGPLLALFYDSITLSFTHNLMQTLYESCESVTLPSSELPPDDICVVLSEGRFNALDGLVVHTLHIA